MSKKLKYLTKMSLNKKIKTKWFLIANITFALLIIGLINIDSVIKFFGGDFDKTTYIYFLDNSGYTDYDYFSSLVSQNGSYLEINSEIENIEDYDSGYNKVVSAEDNNTILVVIDKDDDNYMKAKVISNSDIDSSLYQVITNSIDEIKREYALSCYGIDNETLLNINSSVDIERVKLLDEGTSEDDKEFMMGVIFPILLFPVFMLSMFLIQMIGAEINEEKSTRSMEIIISNVSAKTHFLSKLISGNCFVLLQGLLLIFYVILALAVRFLLTGGIDITAILGSEALTTIDNFSECLNISKVITIIPIFLVFIFLSFIGYSLLSAITASMTTNMEDYEQVSSPVVMINLVGYYLVIMASLFNGSLFIRILSYIPFISTMLSPALFILGQIGTVDVVISVIIMIGVIYLLIKYGLRIYKVGILNYSSSNIWKKMFKAIWNK